MSRAAALVAVAALAAACGFGEPRVYTDRVRTVPDVVGRHVREAQGVLEGDGFVARLAREGETGTEELDPARCPDAPVLAQDPPPGTKAVKATTVTTTVRSCP